MTDWHGNRSREQYVYKRVKWNPGNAGHFGEMEEYGLVTSGSVELSAFTDLKASCTFSFEGGTPPDTTDLVRIYYSFTDDHGNSESVPLGTFFVSYGEVSYTRDGDELKASGSVDGSSVLAALLDRKLGAPYTIETTTNGVATDCVGLADSIVRGFGLPTNGPESNGVKVKAPHTFEPDDSWLTVVNWLLTTANFQAAYPDPMGNVMMSAYVDPQSRTTTASFKDDARSIMRPEVSMANDWFETPNVCRVYFESETECLAASASLVSGSRASLNARGGREVTMVESVDELEGANQTARVTNLEAIAKQRLIDNASEIEKVTFTHAYIPMQPNDKIEIEYSDMTWGGNVANMTVSLTPSTQCQTQLRRFVDNDLTINTDGGPVW